MTPTLSYIEKNFRLNWEGKRERIKPRLTKPLRTTISAPRLIEIIGESRANFLFNSMCKMKGDKKTFSVQDKGKLTVYVK
jgi:hypothetical protein